MRIFLKLAFLVLVMASLSHAQSTTVSGTITDANGQIFASGIYRIEFNANGHNAPFYWNGSPFTPSVYAGSLDITGSFAGISVPSSTSISPAGTNWKFTMCPASSSPCWTQNIAMTGTTMNVSSIITPPAIIIPANAYNQPVAYQDAEIIGPTVGFIYFNKTLQHPRACTVQVPCTWVTLCIEGDPTCGAGGGITQVTGINPIVVTNNTTTPIVSCPTCAPGTIAPAPQYSPTYYTAPGITDILGGLPPPTTFGVWQEVWNTGVGGAVAPTFRLSGIPVDTESGASPTVVGDTTGTDRTTLLRTTNNTTSTALTVPAPFGSNFPFVHCNAGTVVATDTPTASKVNGNSTLVLQSQPSGGNPPCAFWWSDNTNWFAALIPGTDTNGQLPGPSLEPQYTKLECLPGLGDGYNAMAAQTYLQLNCVNRSGVTWTITGISCFTDNAGTSTLSAANNAATALLTGAITCNNTKSAGGQAGTLAVTTLANNDAINFSFLADGTSKQTTWTVTFTQ